MLLFKTILFITIACAVLVYFSVKNDWDICLSFAIMFGVIGAFACLILGLEISQANNATYIKDVITDKTVEYNGLIRELELIEAGDESLDKSTVYKEIIEYNTNVTSYKENAYNRWLSGLYSKEIADNLQLIEF